MTVSEGEGVDTERLRVLAGMTAWRGSTPAERAWGGEMRRQINRAANEIDRLRALPTIDVRPSRGSWLEGDDPPPVTLHVLGAPEHVAALRKALAESDRLRVVAGRAERLRTEAEKIVAQEERAFAQDQRDPLSNVRASLARDVIAWLDGRYDTVDTYDRHDCEL